ncbi:hypothetical protein [Spiroplasma endosymbiont of Virgichneumon dumeticola]|uniref:hypothetical protein n=1 Tax=Spiroplasma endosymbiont of Virgichneumon dumeticola TaxID=3139323 RepID=UPI0035C9231C
MPKNKGEIDNFANGISFHDYLQTQANSKFHGWQLQMGLGIGLPLLGGAIISYLIFYWKFSARHNPIKKS